MCMISRFAFWRNSYLILLEFNGRAELRERQHIANDSTTLELALTSLESHSRTRTPSSQVPCCLMQANYIPLI